MSCTSTSQVEAGSQEIKGLGERIDALEEQEQDGGDYLLKSGDVMSGVLNMDNNYIAKVKDPESGTDATNRRYVENNFVLLYVNQHRAALIVVRMAHSGQEQERSSRSTPTTAPAAVFNLQDRHRWTTTRLAVATGQGKRRPEVRHQHGV